MAGSKTTLFDVHKFVLFHLMENLPFDLPHTIYINIIKNLKGLGCLEDIYYVALINKLLRDQGVYYVFNNMEEDYKYTLLVKGSVVAKQQKFSKTNLKAMKVALEQTLNEALEVDVDAINERKKKELAKSIAVEDLGLDSFGITRKIKKIMVEQQKKKKTRKQSQRDEEEEELLAKEHKTKIKKMMELINQEGG